jgi:dTDP-6-deoxy-L-talose 4-dehydrogenase (NAD+)
MTGAVLLTGATGFVGRQVLKVLGECGARVRVVVREGTRSRLARQEAIERIITTQDLFGEHESWWAEACQGIDTVIHAAWYAEPGQYLQSDKNIDCLVGTLKLAKGATRSKVRRFIGIGTCFEYDLAEGMLSVTTPLLALTPYAAAKAATFMMLSQWFPLQGIEFAWCRLFYLYGEGEDTRRLVPYLRSKLAAGESAELTSGNQVRDFLDVSTAARMIVDTAFSDDQGPVNICSGIPTTVRQLAEQIADEYDARDLLKFGARPDNFIDPPCVVGIRHKSIL